MQGQVAQAGVTGASAPVFADRLSAVAQFEIGKLADVGGDGGSR
jgi:hypothetical protein